MHVRRCVIDGLTSKKTSADFLAEMELLSTETDTQIETQPDRANKYYTYRDQRIVGPRQSVRQYINAIREQQHRAIASVWCCCVSERSSTTATSP